VVTGGRSSAYAGSSVRAATRSRSGTGSPRFPLDAATGEDGLQAYQQLIEAGQLRQHVTPALVVDSELATDPVQAAEYFAHLKLVHHSDYGRFARLGVVASVPPTT
jgi:hypothetical protein